MSKSKSNRTRGLKPGWQPGQSGNPKGRPRGSRNKLAEDFLVDLHTDWMAHGAQAIAEVREKRPDVYLRVVAHVLPKEVHFKTDSVFASMTDEQLEQHLADIRRALAAAAPTGDGAGGETPSGEGPADPLYRVH
jgi:hypothetical protein